MSEHQVVSYKCPNCGAPLPFDIERQDWQCKFCLSAFTLQDLEKAEPLETEAAPPPPTDRYSNEETAAYSCPSCGGHILTDKNTAATFCVYCHNPTVIPQRLSGELRPARLIPFKLNKQEVQNAMGRLLKKRPLLPREFREYVEKGEIGGMYVPFWLFDTDVDAHVSARGLRVTSWSDRNYRYTKTDTFHVERAATISYRNIPADGSQKMDDRLMQALEPFHYEELTGFSTGYLSGHFAESYDVDSTQSSSAALGRIQNGVSQMMRSQIHGYTSYTITAENQRRKNTRCTYVMLPVWTLMTRYNDKQYIYAMNGQTGKAVGRLPISKSQVLKWFGIVSGAVALLVFVGGMVL